jgi:hypothetical protein
MATRGSVRVGAVALSQRGDNALGVEGVPAARRDPAGGSALSAIVRMSH